MDGRVEPDQVDLPCESLHHYIAPLVSVREKLVENY